MLHAFICVDSLTLEISMIQTKVVSWLHMKKVDSIKLALSKVSYVSASTVELSVNLLYVSVIVDAVTPQEWIVKTLEKLDQHPNIQISRIILQNVEGAIDASSAETQKSVSLLQRMCIGLSRYIDQARFPDNPLEPRPLPDSLQALLSHATQGPAYHAEQSSTAQTDVVLHCGDLDSALPKNTPTAKEGIWFIDRNGLPEQLEHSMLTRPSLIWIHLWRWTDQQQQSTERVASHALPLQSFSISDVRNYGFACLPNFIVSRLNWLANGIDPIEHEKNQIASHLVTEDAFPTSYQAKKKPGRYFCLRTVLLFLAYTKQRIRNRLQQEQWQLGFIHSQDHGSKHQVDEFQAIAPPDGTIWADPHLIQKDGNTHVFFEELHLKENKGRIASAVLTSNGFEQAPVTVLKESHHLSYPFVFEHENTVYMIPETASMRTISLYKASVFPTAWEYMGNLMENIDAADSTLYKHNGVWWLFTNGMSHPNVDERDQLLLFYSDDLLGAQWHAHPLNPVVTGVDRARMAGNLYTRQGELFRPSQYGANRYGFGVNISRITQLSKTDYQETAIERLVPSSNTKWIGCHSAVHSNELIVIDRLKRVLNFTNFQ